MKSLLSTPTALAYIVIAIIILVVMAAVIGVKRLRKANAIACTAREAADQEAMYDGAHNRMKGTYDRVYNRMVVEFYDVRD